MRDHTQPAELSAELVSVRSFSDSLRAQTNEYANRLHMVVSLLETGHVDEAIDFAAKDLDDLNRVKGDGSMTFDHPVLSALLLSKIAQAAEEGIEMTVDTAELTGRLSGDDRDRSEEHTSELQSRGHLVCRLLLEKKKKQKNTRT